MSASCPSQSNVDRLLHQVVHVAGVVPGVELDSLNKFGQFALESLLVKVPAVDPIRVARQGDRTVPHVWKQVWRDLREIDKEVAFRKRSVLFSGLPELL